MPEPASASVALCTFNGARFLRAQLDSIAAQTVPVKEIVICDDGSIDQTLEVIKAFSEVSRTVVRVERNQTNLGVTKNFEKAISLCTGEVIFPCDQDDIWQPTKVEKLLGALADDSVAMAFSNAAVVYEDLSPAGYRLWESVWFTATEQMQFEQGHAFAVLLKHAVAAGSTLAFKSKYLPILLPIPDFPHSHDIWITLVLSAVSKVVPVNEDLIQYRLHQANQVGMKKHGLVSQLKMAKKQIQTNAFLYAADLHEAAHFRLANSDPLRWTVAHRSFALLREKVEHSRRRHCLPRWPILKWGVIGTEIYRGNYRRYAYGFKSVLQDLFLR